jgi:hypothetical protein
MKTIKVIVLSVILALAAIAARHAYIVGSTPVDTTTQSFDYIMAGMFAVCGVIILAFLAILLMYSILESNQTTTVEIAAEIKPAAVKTKLTAAEYTNRQAALVAEYNARQAAAIAEYNARQAALVAAYNARNN